MHTQGLGLHTAETRSTRKSGLTATARGFQLFCFRVSRNLIAVRHGFNNLVAYTRVVAIHGALLVLRSRVELDNKTQIKRQRKHTCEYETTRSLQRTLTYRDDRKR